MIRVARRRAVVDHRRAGTLHRHLGHPLLAFGTPDFVRRVAKPLLDDVRQRWSDGRSSIADEDLLSGLMRNLLTGAVAVRRVARELPPETELWLGGRGAAAVGAAIGSGRAVVLDQMPLLEIELARVCAPAAARA
jgi:hypothetical protein